MTAQSQPDDLDRRRSAALAMGGEAKLAKRRAKGILDARARIDHLLDPGSFHEVGPARHLRDAWGSRPDARRWQDRRLWAYRHARGRYRLQRFYREGRVEQRHQRQEDRPYQTRRDPARDADRVPRRIIRRAHAGHHGRARHGHHARLRWHAISADARDAMGRRRARRLLRLVDLVHLLLGFCRHAQGRGVGGVEPGPGRAGAERNRRSAERSADGSCMPRPPA